MYDVIIIGGGASGVMCAITASQKKKKVLLLDAGAYPAKKLLVTGNGKCNITNIDCDNMFYNQNIDEYLKRFSQADTLKFFNELGLLTYNDECGRVYPFSNSAKSVVEVLHNKLKKLNVETKPNTLVTNVSKNNEVYIVKTQSESYYSKNVVVASGGNSVKEYLNNLLPQSTGIMPSLCALLTESTKKLSGIRLSNVLVTVKCGDVKKSEIGELLFKDSGVSGIVIFNLSSIFARQKSFLGEVCINLMPTHSFKEIERILNIRIKQNDNVEQVFTGWFVKEIGNEILRKANVDVKTKCNKLTDVQIKNIANTIACLNYEVVGCYDNNQVFSGGVKLDVLTKNLESKKHKGLYFCGEVLDVDGVCGGYNLQWAWTSGHIVGESL